MNKKLLSLLLGSGILLTACAKKEISLHPVKLPSDLDAYLADEEGKIPDLVKGTEKTIVWAYPDKRKTKYSIIYIHGFTASRQETYPTFDMVAKNIGANLFYTRLTAHGQGAEAFSNVTVEDWYNDANEALEIGKQIGENVIAAGASTGAPLAVWLAKKDSAVKAIVLSSPNFGPADKNAYIVLWPFGINIAKMLVGPYNSWKPENDAHARYFTPKYRTEGLLPMMQLVQFGQTNDYVSMQTPALFLMCPKDNVVDTNQIKAIFQKLGSPVKELAIITNGAGHVLSGDILSPTSTEDVAEIVTGFINNIK